MSAVQRGRNYQRYVPTESLGTLTGVNLQFVIKQKSLQGLEQLSNFCQRMKLNPFWYERETVQNKLKFLQIYQYSLNYSKNLKNTYNETQKVQIQENVKLKQEIQNKKNSMKAQKKKVEQMKEQYRKIKIDHIKKVEKDHELKLQRIRKQQLQLHFKKTKLEQQINAKKRQMSVPIPIPSYYPVYQQLPPMVNQIVQNQNLQDQYNQPQPRFNNEPNPQFMNVNNNQNINIPPQQQRTQQNVSHIFQALQVGLANKMQIQTQKVIEQHHQSLISSSKNISKNSRNSQGQSSIDLIDQFPKDSIRQSQKFSGRFGKDSKLQINTNQVDQNKQIYFHDDIIVSPTNKIDLSKKIIEQEKKFPDIQILNTINKQTGSRLGSSIKKINRKSVINYENSQSYIKGDDSIFGKSLAVQSKINIEAPKIQRNTDTKQLNQNLDKSSSVKLNNNLSVSSQKQQFDRNALLNSKNGSAKDLNNQLDDFDKLLQSDQNDKQIQIASKIMVRKQKQNLGTSINNKINLGKTSLAFEKNQQIDQVNQDQQLESAHTNSNIHKNSSIIPPVLDKQNYQQQDNYDYQQDFEDNDDMDFGLDSNIKKNPLPKNDDKLLKNDDKVSNNKLTTERSQVNIKIPQTSSYLKDENNSYVELLDQKFQLKQQYKNKNNTNQQNLGSKQWKNQPSIMIKSNEKGIRESGSNGDNMFLDIEMPQNSQIGYKGKGSARKLQQKGQQTEINIRVLNDRGSVLQQNKKNLNEEKQKSSLKDINSDNFIDLSKLDNLKSINLSKKANKNNEIVESTTFNSDFIIPFNNSQNQQKQQKFMTLKSVLKTKKQKEDNQQVQEQITYNLLDSKAEQYQKQQIQQQIVKIIRNKQKLQQNSSQIMKKKNEQILQQIDKDIVKQIKSKLKQNSIKTRDWKVIQKLFSDEFKQLSKASQIKSQQIKQKINKIQQQSLKPKNIQNKQNLNNQDEERDTQLNYSASFNEKFIPINSSNQKIDSIKQIPKVEQTIKSSNKRQNSNKLGYSDDMFELPQNSKVVAKQPNKKVSRQNNLINTNNNNNNSKQPQSSTLQQVSKSKYAMKKSSKQEQKSKSIPKQSIVSKLQQNKYNREDPLANDISKANNIFKKVQDDEDDDF